MGTEWVVELLSGIGKLFLNPLFYYSFLICIVIGYRRVKQERKDFKIRVQDGLYEMRNLLPLGILIGLLFSIMTVAVGLTIPIAAIQVIVILTIIMSLIGKFRLLSPTYVIGITIFVLFFLFKKEVPIPFLGDAIKEMDGQLFPVLAIVMGLLIIAEGILIMKNAFKSSSPKLITSNRGMTVGAHISRRVWMVPLMLFVPGGELAAPFEWWPLLSLGDDVQVTPILIPFLLGFSQQVQGSLPKESIKVSGLRIIALGFIVLAVAIGSIWWPILTIAVAAIAILGRESIHYFNKLHEQQSSFYFSQRDHGVLILGIIPHSPAEKMALEVGEIITKVNGTPVHSEKQLYEALQYNLAHCKLEVLDSNNQIRFVQRALFQGEHYELGILFIPEERSSKKIG
ncbi:PDZ domain-containing protein [Bacillus sp. JJ722]|uniref:PDZ domain-containing protein n=1 Tax=Bacillus sp. JJ722 TaxID=3122973 RepID=UPI003000CA0B